MPLSCSCKFYLENQSLTFSSLKLQASSSYWRGKSDRESLQRVYGISFPDAKRLKVHFCIARLNFLCPTHQKLFVDFSSCQLLTTKFHISWNCLSCGDFLLFIMFCLIQGCKNVWIVQIMQYGCSASYYFRKGVHSFSVFVRCKTVELKCWVIDADP